MSNEIRDPLTKRSHFIGTSFATIVYLYLLMPIIVVIPVAFGTPNELRFPPSQYSLELFRIFSSSEQWTSPLIQSVRVAAFTTGVVLLAGVPAAYGIARFDFPGKKLIAAMMMSSLVIPTIVTSLGLYLYFSILRINSTTLALVLGHVTYTMPFVMVMIIAGVQKLDRNLEFGAELMGAGRLYMFMTVVLPQLLPSLIGAGLFAFLISFDEVVISWFLSGTTTATLPVKMYSAIRWEISPVIAAVSTLLTAISLIVCLIMIALKKTTPIDG
jgi:putative spermidine/putrescine transport system permease protein